MGLFEKLGLIWCRFWHDSKPIMWGGGRAYTCVRCGRRYATGWADRDSRGIESDVYTCQ